MPPSEVEKIFPAFAESRKAELPRFTPDSILITPENKFDDAIYNYLYAYWKEYSGKYDPKGNVVASNTANHLSLEYKTENELRFAQWAMREYGMTNKERTTHTFKGQMSVLLEVWNVVDMITLPISLVSAGGKFIGKEVAKEVGEELGEKAVKEVAEETVEKTVKREVAEEAIKNPVKREVAEKAIEKTVKTEVSEEVAETTIKKEMVDTAEDLTRKVINKENVLENNSIIKAESNSIKEMKINNIIDNIESISNNIIDINKRYADGYQMNNSIENILNSASYYNDPYEQVAAVARSIIDHAFANGNKRTALNTINMLLNDFKLDNLLTDTQKWDLIYDIAEGRVYDVSEIANILKGK